MLPHFGDDLYRAVMVVPGVSGGDISGRFNVRGGLHDEVLVRLDGLELFEPLHLKDFQGVFTILDPNVIGSLEVTTGGYPVEFGDRMTAVLDMTTLKPRSRRTGEVGLHRNRRIGSIVWVRQLDEPRGICSSHPRARGRASPAPRMSSGKARA